MGWELFKNYLIARDKYKPDFFLYENNKSMSAAIRAQITREFGFEPICINSALVSAQNRQRLYWIGRREPDGTYSRVDVAQPKDRGILLRDILETGAAFKEKAYTLKGSYGKTGPANFVDTNHFPAAGVGEPINVTEDGKSQTIKAQYAKSSVANFCCYTSTYGASGVAEPICINPIQTGKSRTVDAHMGKLENNLVPRINDPNPAKQQYDCIAEPVRIGTIEGGTGKNDGQALRVYSPDGKGRMLLSTDGGAGAGTGLYAVPAEGKKGIVYEVRDGKITIKGKEYPIKLADGFYIIRKLTVTECKRLQTVPEWYDFPVSSTQAYKMLGNGWTVEVIMHLLGHISGIAQEPVEVLSMYDGMSCGHIALNALGAQITRYFASEIDKYAIQTTQHNFPETIQIGDAFAVREDGWNLEDFA